MPRTSRSVAQRLATQTKSKRRRPARPTSPLPEGTPAATPETTGVSPAAAGPSVEQILDEVVPSGAGQRATATPTLAPPAAGATLVTATSRRGAGGRAGRATAIRRRYSEYAEEYQYIWADLRRIMIVAAVLIAMLIALSFFIE